MRIRAFALGLGLSLASAHSAALAAPPAAPAVGGATSNAATMTVGEYPTCTKTPVSKEDSEAAHQQYTVGKVKYDEADFSEAVARFLRAYKLDCTKHELLVIISRSFDMVNNRPEAIRALETFLKRATLSTAETSSIEARIANMKRQLAENPPLATVPNAGAAGGAVNPPRPLPDPVTTPAGEVREHTVYPWLVVGTGALAIGVGAVVTVLAPPLPSGCDPSTGTCTARPGDKIVPGNTPAETKNVDLDARKEKAGQSVGMTTGGFVTMIGGGVLVAGGLIWHFVEPTGPRPPAKTATKPVLTPALGAGFAGLGLGGQF
jgi:hypothetical protein